MKKMLVGLFFLQVLLFLLIYSSQAQTPVSHKHLAGFGRVWGFLKYYHPDAALGKPDWDSALVRMIPFIENAGNEEGYHKILEEWYRQLPRATATSGNINIKSDSIDRVFTEENLRSFLLPAFLKKEFVSLYRFHQPGASRYITRHYQGYYFDHIIHTEDAHEQPAYPSREFRLLALFRYWNSIEYFYPHRKRIKNWNQVLEKYIPIFLQAADSTQYRQAVKALIHELPDAHSFLQEPGAVYYFTPFRVDYIDGKFLIGQCAPQIARQWDYQVGDEIVRIGRQSVEERLRQLRNTVTGTNQASLYRNFAGELLKTGDSVITVMLKRKGVFVERTVELHCWEVYRNLPKAPAQHLWSQVEQGIWYVRFCAISNPDTLKYLFKEVQNARAIIWDMRGYPSFPVTTRLAYFLFDQKTQLTEERNASDSFPGTFVKSPLYFIPETGGANLYRGKMIVLVDEYTQSLAESVAAMLRLRPNTIVMGRPTAGTTGNITWFSLPGNLAVSYTGVGVTGARGTFEQGKGVKLDRPVRITQQDLLLKEDPILELATQLAKKSSQ